MLHSHAASAYDAIIIGGGHNGLACAAYLAKGGLKPLVLEAREIVGGFATTESVIPNFPQARSPVASMDLVSINMPPSVIDELDLASRGLRFVDVDPFYSTVTEDGRSFAFWRSVERTCDEIAVFSAADAKRYRELNTLFVAFWKTLSPYLHAHPLKPGAGTILAALGQAIANRAHLGEAARYMFMSPQAVIEENFESEPLRAALACFAAASGSPLDEPGSGIIMAMMAMQHEWGVRRAVGGMGAFTQALREVAEAHGAEVRVSAPVRRVLTRDGRAIGIETEDGETITAPHVIAAVDPKSLFQNMMAPDDVPGKLRAELRAMGVWRANIAPMRVDFLVRGTPQLTAGPERARTLLPASMLLGPTFEGTSAFLKAAQAGHIADGPVPIWPASPSRIDRTLSPDEAYDTFYVFVPAVPYKLADGARWEDRREEIGGRILQTMAAVMPGLEEQVVGRSVRTPDDIADMSRIHRGNAYHVDMSLAQMGPWRPTPSLAGYATPIPGLWHTGAGAHPMGSVNGLSGKLAAQTVLRAHRGSRRAA